MLKNRKAQMFTMLLALFTIIILSTALFYLSQKSAKFDGVIGKDAYGVSKLYHANNKLLLFYESLARNDLKESMTSVLRSDRNNQCGEIDEVSLWRAGDKDCTPDYLSLIEKDFNLRFKDRLSLMDQERLFSYRSAYSFSEVFSKLGSSVISTRSSIYAKKWSTEIFALVKSKDSPKEMYFHVVPDDDQESVHIIGDDSWVLDMGDANTGLLLARVEQIPSFRIDTDLNIYGILDIQKLPDKIIKECSDKSDSELRGCATRLLQKLKDEQVISHFASLSWGRDLVVKISLREKGIGFDIEFAVRIPAQGLFVFGPISVEQDEKPKTASAFRLEKQTPLIVMSQIQVPSIQDLTIELCTQTNEKDSQKTCAGNIVFQNNGSQQGAQGTTISEDFKSIDVMYSWDKFPKANFEMWFEAKIKDSNIRSGRVIVINGLE